MILCGIARALQALCQFGLIKYAASPAVLAVGGVHGDRSGLRRGDSGQAATGLAFSVPAIRHRVQLRAGGACYEKTPEKPGFL